MTCIAGIRYNGKVYIGGDSAGSTHYTCTIRKDPKVFKVNDFIMGFTTSFRMGQLLQYNFTPPKLPSTSSFKKDIHKYMCTDFVDGIRKVFKDGGYSEINDNVERGGVFLVGIRDRLFYVGGNFQVGEPADDYTAIGCGIDFALGSLYTTEDLDISLSPGDRLTLALEAATEYSTYVRPPYTILST